MGSVDVQGLKKAQMDCMEIEIEKLHWLDTDEDILCFTSLLPRTVPNTHTRVKGIKARIIPLPFWKG